MVTSTSVRELGHLMVTVSRADQAALPDIAMEIMGRAATEDASAGYVISAEVADGPNDDDYLTVSFVAYGDQGAHTIQSRIETWITGTASSAKVKHGHRHGQRTGSGTPPPPPPPDNYTRGYFQIRGRTTDLKSIADSIMAGASDFLRSGTVVRDRSALGSTKGYACCGVVTRADEINIQPLDVKCIIAPFIVYEPSTKSVIRDEVIALVRKAVTNIDSSAEVKVMVVDDHHGMPDMPRRHLGREEMHQPGNPHGNSFG